MQIDANSAKLSSAKQSTKVQNNAEQCETMQGNAKQAKECEAMRSNAEYRKATLQLCCTEHCVFQGFAYHHRVVAQCTRKERGCFIATRVSRAHEKSEGLPRSRCKSTMTNWQKKKLASGFTGAQHAAVQRANRFAERMADAPLRALQSCGQCRSGVRAVTYCTDLSYER